MARESSAKTSRRKRPRSATPGRAVMRAFRTCRSSAPSFVSSCGIFPEVSESASDQLHRIVDDVATGQLNKGRVLKALQNKIRRLAGRGNGRNGRADLVDRIGGDLTVLLASEATAAYLFGLSVGMIVRSLPDRLDR